MILLVKRADELEGGDKLASTSWDGFRTVEDVTKAGFGVIVDVGYVERIELQNHQLVGVWV